MYLHRTRRTDSAPPKKTRRTCQPREIEYTHKSKFAPALIINCAEGLACINNSNKLKQEHGCMNKMDQSRRGKTFGALIWNWHQMCLQQMKLACCQRTSHFIVRCSVRNIEMSFFHKFFYHCSLYSSVGSVFHFVPCVLSSLQQCDIKDCFASVRFITCFSFSLRFFLNSITCIGNSVK